MLNAVTNQMSDEKTCSLLHTMIKHIEFNCDLEQEDFDESVTNLERLDVHMKSTDDTIQKRSAMLTNMNKLRIIFINTVHPLPNGFIDRIRESMVDMRECYICGERAHVSLFGVDANYCFVFCLHPLSFKSPEG